MLKNNQLKILLIVVCLGILTLLLISSLTSPKKTEISKISYDLLDRKVSIEGLVTNIAQIDSLTILTLSDSYRNNINVICNCNNTKINMKNKTVYIQGTVQEYKNTLQINADKISIKNIWIM